MMVSETNNTVINCGLESQHRHQKYHECIYVELYLNNHHIRWTIGEIFCNFAMSSRPSTAVCEKLLTGAFAS